MNKILITEDDKTISDALVMVLKDAGYDVLAVYDGLRGYLRSNLWNPDLILMDVNLGASTGFEVAREIKDKNIPIIFMTAMDKSKFQKDAEPFHPVAFLEKPINISDLLSRIKRHFDNLTTHQVDDSMLTQYEIITRRNSRVSQTCSSTSHPS